MIATFPEKLHKSLVNMYMFGTDFFCGLQNDRYKWRFQELEWPKLDPSRDWRAYVWICSVWINPHSKRLVMCMFMLQVNWLFDKQFCWSKFTNNSRMPFECPEHTGRKTILNIISTFSWPSCRWSDPVVPLLRLFISPLALEAAPHQDIRGVMVHGRLLEYGGERPRRAPWELVDRVEKTVST